MTETRDQLEASRAHHAYRAGYLERENARLYDKLRRLENKVRKTIVIGERIDTDGLADLRRMVPAKPRLTRAQQRKSKRGN